MKGVVYLGTSAAIGRRRSAVRFVSRHDARTPSLPAGGMDRLSDFITQIYQAEGMGSEGQIEVEGNLNLIKTSAILLLILGILHILAMNMHGLCELCVLPVKFSIVKKSVE